MCCGFENKDAQKNQNNSLPKVQAASVAPAGLLDTLKSCFTRDAGRKALEAVAAEVGKTIRMIGDDVRRGQASFERSKLNPIEIEMSFRRRFR